MSNVIPIRRFTTKQAEGTGIAVAYMACRYGMNEHEAACLAEDAKMMVEKGMTPGKVRSKLLTRLRKSCTPVCA